MLLQIISSESLKDSELSISLIDKLFEQLLDSAILLGQRILLAAVIFFIGRWLIRLLRSFISRFLERKKIEKTVKSFLDSMASVTLKIVLFVIIVNVLGVSTTSFAAILAAAGLAIGMAMKDNLSNFAGGVMLLINKPFKVGDRVLSQGMDGVVQSIGILYTVLLTGDNRTIFIPNGPLSTGNIINFSTQPNRRVDITLNVNYGIEVDDIKKIIEGILASDKRIKNIPSSPFIGVTMLNNGTIDITIRVWVDTGDYASVNVYLNEAIYAQFSEQGIYSPSTLSVKMLKE